MTDWSTFKEKSNHYHLHWLTINTVTLKWFNCTSSAWCVCVCVCSITCLCVCVYVCVWAYLAENNLLTKTFTLCFFSQMDLMCFVMETHLISSQVRQQWPQFHSGSSHSHFSRFAFDRIIHKTSGSDLSSGWWHVKARWAGFHSTYWSVKVVQATATLITGVEPVSFSNSSRVQMKP